MESREIFKRKIVLNWINQFLPEQLGEEKQYTIKDFESGIILCDLINSIVFNNQHGDFYFSINRQFTIDAIYDNWNLALRSHEIFLEFKNFPLEELIRNQSKIVEILVKIYDFNTTKGEIIQPISQNFVKESGRETTEVQSSRGMGFRQKSSKRFISKSKRKKLFTDEEEDESFIQNEKDSRSKKEEKKFLNFEDIDIRFKKTPQNSKRRCRSRLATKSPNSSIEVIPPAKMTEKQRNIYHKKMKENNQELLKRSNSRRFSGRKKSVVEVLRDKTNVLKKYLNSKSKNRKRSNSRRRSRKKSNSAKMKRCRKQVKGLTPLEVNAKTQLKVSSRSKAFSRISKDLDLEKNQGSMSRRCPEGVDVPPRNIIIDKIQVKNFKKVKNWLVEKFYCKSTTDFKNLHLTSRNGVFLFELINKIQRKRVLKGRSTHNATSIKINYKKIMDYLSGFERFNPRYLKASFYLINGDFNVFWGILIDLYYFSLNKISIFDKRYKENRAPKNLNDLDYELSKDNFEEQPTDYESRSKIIAPDDLGEESIYVNFLCEQKSSINFELSTKNECLKTEGFEQKNQKENEFGFQVHTFGSDREVRMRKNSPKKSLRKVKTLDYKELVLLEAKVKSWLGDLGFEIIYHSNICEDKLRNGFVLHKILSMIFSEYNGMSFEHPKSPEGCLMNLSGLMKKFSDFEKKIEIFEPERILKGEPSSIWQFYDTVREIWRDNFEIEGDVKYIPKQQKGSDHGAKKPELIDEAQNIYDWIISLNLYEKSEQPFDFQELLIRMGDGVLLSKLVERVFKVRVKRLNQNPRDRMDCFNNIRFCFAEMRKFKNMEDRFFNRVKQIYDLNLEECIGLLKDIKKFSRQSEENYFQVGRQYQVMDKTVKKKRFSSKESRGDSKKRKDKFLKSFDLGDSKREALADLDQRVIKTRDFREVSNTKREFFKTNMSLYESKSNKKQGRYQEQKLKFVSPDYKPPLSFHNIKTVIRLLIYLDMPKIIERENWDSSIWSQFSDGLTFASMINRLELNNIINLPHDNARTTVDCLENLSVILYYLGIDAESYSEKILKGEPKAIYTVVRFMWDNYSKRIKEIEDIRGGV